MKGHRKLLHFYDHPELPKLFDLSADRGEVHNIAERHPETWEQLHKEMTNDLEQVGVRIPKPNPSFDEKAYQQAKESERRISWGAFAGSRSLAEDEET